MEKLWFIYSNEIVSGPYSTEQVKVSLLGGRWGPDAQVWWKGQKEWLPVDKWYQQLDSILEANRRQGQQPVWYAEKEGQQLGPVTKNDLVSYLKTLKDIYSVRLWTIGQNHWANLFEFHEIINQLGITKRNYERAAIVGSVMIQRHGESLEKTLSSVSGGGVGVKDCKNLVAGEVVVLQIRSPLLIAPVRATAKVMYVEDSGYAGLQFQTIHIESKTTLMDYVKQFKGEGGALPSEATRIKKVG